MSGEPELRGRCILIVEDDYYLATDATRALESAGAEVAGPFPTEGAAGAALEVRRPDAALIDINLGGKVSFGLAGRLLEAGIPFAFVTGYDAGIIPERFGGVGRIEKPLAPWQVVLAASRLLGLADAPGDGGPVREMRAAETSGTPRR